MAWIIPEPPAGRALRCWRLALLLAAAALLGACSGTTFLYNRLDFLVPWYVDDYVELTDPQERALDNLLEPFLEWHRREELPRYATLLQQAEDALEEELTEAELRGLIREVEIAGDRVQTRSLDWLLPVAEQLSEEQIAELIGNLWEKQEELEEKYLERDEEEYRDDAYDRLLDKCQDYMGRLNARQRHMLRQGVAKLYRSDRVWLGERESWIGRIEGLMQREPGWQQRVRDALATRWESSSTDYRAAYLYNLQAIQESLRAVINDRSEDQDHHLRRKLHMLRKDFVALSREGLRELSGIPAATP